VPYLVVSLDGREDLELPEGCFVVRLHAPGHAPSRWTPPAELRDLPPLAAGRLRWKVTDTSGRALPAKILVRGMDKTPDPSFGEEADSGAAINAVYSLGDGERALPPGRYRVFVHRGPEYTAVMREIAVGANQTVVVDAKLDRVVDTTGWISADLHVHAEPSMDAPVPLEDRVRSLAAVGLEVAVATDHNVLTDYGPAIRSLDLGSRVTSIVGDEVTTRDVYFGHFNVFPLPAGAAAVPFISIPPERLFAAARGAAAPGRPPIVQVNHPRMGSIGYFELLRLDPASVGGWLKRAPLADMSFDALEVFNGDHYDDLAKVEACLHDWFALLEAGFHPTATGNSDSHTLTYQDAGVPRNWVAVPDDDPSHFDERAFVEAVRGGRVIVSSGPFIRLEAGGKGVGSKVPAGSTAIRIRVDAPPWVDVDRVELIVRGRIVRDYAVTTASGTRRLDEKITLDLEPRDWIIALARGSKPLAYLHRKESRPFAFTNPIWVE
jgi:hypothetical protein